MVLAINDIKVERETILLAYSIFPGEHEMKPYQENQFNHLWHHIYCMQVWLVHFVPWKQMFPSHLGWINITKRRGLDLYGGYMKSGTLMFASHGNNILMHWQNFPLDSGDIGHCQLQKLVLNAHTTQLGVYKPLSRVWFDLDLTFCRFQSWTRYRQCVAHCNTDEKHEFNTSSEVEIKHHWLTKTYLLALKPIAKGGHDDLILGLLRGMIQIIQYNFRVTPADQHNQKQNNMYQMGFAASTGHRKGHEMNINKCSTYTSQNKSDVYHTL